MVHSCYSSESICSGPLAIWPLRVPRATVAGRVGTLSNTAMLTHGDTRNGKLPPIYVVWMGMKNRCQCKNASSYKYYGGKGIKVCDDWKSSYQSFKNWALTNGYAFGLQIDRISPAGNYEPSNCRFVTTKQNAFNRRSTIVINGLSFKQTCLNRGLSPHVVRYRMKNLGLDLESALSMPLTPNGHKRQTIARELKLGKWEE